MDYKYLDDYLDNLPFLKELSYLELVFFINISMKYSEVEDNDSATFEFRKILDELLTKIRVEDENQYNFIKDYYENGYKIDPEGVNEFITGLISKVKLLSQSFNQSAYIVLNEDKWGKLNYLFLILEKYYIIILFYSSFVQKKM